ncbi:MAG TPA: hypothetical protein VGY55_06685 [Pirellulales bacterium]|nr:hypothetical protein [Pirellulales bacterium]
MIRKLPKPPATQRRFASSWAELDYLCKKIRYWLYSRKQTASAQRYVDRLERVLRDVPDNDMAIIREEALALLSELKGSVREAIAHRTREIELMKRLHVDARSPNYSDTTMAYMLRDRDSVALQERRAILETLERTNGRQIDALAPRRK